MLCRVDLGTLTIYNAIIQFACEKVQTKSTIQRQFSNTSILHTSYQNAKRIVLNLNFIWRVLVKCVSNLNGNWKFVREWFGNTGD